jgi:cellulose synthase/poly-beta-1,6-N-acetylglucosamine synthase-like glycosyltransferase
VRILARQRNRWYRGLVDVLARHRAMVYRPKYRSAGLLGMPYFVFVEALAPLLEAFGLAVLLGGLAARQVSSGSLELIFFAYMMGITGSVVALIFDELAYHTYRGATDRILLCVYAVLEQVVYRPMHLVWRLWGLSSRIAGKTEWGEMQRTGYRVS